MGLIKLRDIYCGDAIRTRSSVIVFFSITASAKQLRNHEQILYGT